MYKHYEQQMQVFISQEMKTDAAHDSLHVSRVVEMAKVIAKAENANLDVVVPAAYLHDCFSHPKNHPQRHTSSRIAADKAIEFLSSLGYDSQLLPAIHHAIVAHSFSANIPAETIEAKVVQDADRLDSLGAIGVTRVVQVGTALERQLYDIEDILCERRQPDDHQYTIDHFWIKLFKIVDTLHTQSARTEGEKRKAFMQMFLKQLAMEAHPKTSV